MIVLYYILVKVSVSVSGGFMEEMKDFEKYTFPWLIFKLNNNDFAVNCETITSITILPTQVTAVPQMPEYTRGLLNLRGTVIPLLDMRCLFGMPSLESECANFAALMDNYIHRHLEWVKELEQSARNNIEFTGETNHHKCAFGIWYDNYKSTNNMVNFHMKKIDEPHKKVHAVGEEIRAIMKEPASPKRQKHIEEALLRLNKQIVPQLVSIIKETNTVLRESYREMVVVLENGKYKIGMIVDEVQSVEQLTYLCKDNDMQAVCDAKYITGVGKSAKTSNMILLVNEDIIKNAFKPSEIETYQNNSALTTV